MGGESTLEETPTWAVAVVCFVLLVISIFIEHGIHLIGKWLKNKHKPALYEALEMIKSELMLLGFISLLLTVLQDPISNICISKSIGATWHPCHKKTEKESKTDYESDDHGRKLLGFLESSMSTRRSLAGGYDNPCPKGKVPFVSYYGIHQLHIFIFVLAVFHVLFCITTLALGRAKMRKWKSWEDETKTIEYQFSNDPERFRFARDTSFGRRHLHVWSQSPVLLWIVCFFRQFFTSSVAKVDYLTLRHGFIMAHLAPRSQKKFDFQKYINRSLEEDFKVVVSISPLMWFFSVLLLLTNTDGWYSYLWLPFIPLIIILLVGAKLQVIITQMGLRIQDRGDVVKGAPLVELGDDLFWFNRPRLILHLIHFVQFQNAFQLAFFAWSWYEFGFRSCFHKRLEDVIIRITMGVIIQFLCSYATLPLYALVTQMGSNMKPTIFGERVAAALQTWHHTAKKHIKHSRQSEPTTPFSRRPTTPTHDMSPVHLLRDYQSSTLYSPQTSHRASNFDNACWDTEGFLSPRNLKVDDSQHNGHSDLQEQHCQTLEPSRTQLPPGSFPIPAQHEINISLADFSFNKRRTS